MPLVIFMDETGNPTLEPEDKQFPVFVLVLFVCDVESYVGEIVPSMYRLKFDFFGHEGVILHSRDIRKSEGDFRFLTDASRRLALFERLNRIMSTLDYQLIATAIHKQKHKERYGDSAANPYELALTFALERLLPLLEGAEQTDVQMIAEARGKREDNDLHRSFLEIVNYGTEYVSRERFKKINFSLTFRSKLMNIVGTQAADLVGYPIARHVLNPAKPNPAFEVVRAKFYRGPGQIRGLKIFP